MKLNVFNSLIGLCVATAAVSCSDALVDDINNRPVGGEKSDMISFVVANNNTTRGGSFGNRPCGGAFLRTADGADSLYMKAEVADMNAELLTRADYDQDNLPVTLSMTCRTRQTGSAYFHYFENETFTQNGGVWSSATPHWWLKDSEHYNFFGFAPADAKGVANYNGHGDTSQIPSIEYTVPATVADQCDLMYHYAGYIDTNDAFHAQEYINTDNSAAPISLKHVLAKVAFKVGDIPEGNITNITLENVRAKGTLDLGTGLWSDVTTGTYSINKFVEGNAKPISGENCLMVIPGMNADNANIVVEFNGKKYEYPLKGYEWQVAQSYTYTINIAPDFTITIDDGSQIVDAHYVIATAKVNAEASAKWNIEVEATDQNGAKVDVTVVRQGNETFKDYVKYYDEGYWLDKIANNGVLSKDTARGYATENGTGEEKLYIFIPENTTDADRTINIKNSGNGEVLASITQRCPAWSSSDPNFGWEQLEETGTAQWGFYSKQKIVYVYNFSYNTLWQNGYLEQEKKMIENLISQYDASEYVTYDLYSTAPAQYRYYVVIDYSKLSNLKNKASSENNGVQNTKDLNAYAGSAYTRSFELALAECTRVNNSSIKAFRTYVAAQDDKFDVPAPVEDNAIQDPMMPYILKKNKYNLNISTFVVEGKDMSTTAPTINENDILWYLPAYQEFNKLPNIVDTSISRSNTWSSTATNNSTDAYVGSESPTTKVRNTYHQIRVARKR